MSAEVLKLRIRGRVWEVRWVGRNNAGFDLDKYWGMCYFEDRVIELSNELPDDLKTRIFLHEVTHAILPHLRERDVERLDRDLTRALEAFGALKERHAEA